MKSPQHAAVKNPYTHTAHPAKQHSLLNVCVSKESRATSTSLLDNKVQVVKKTKQKQNIRVSLQDTHYCTDQIQFSRC